jgi:hypothetical protein
LKPTRGGLGWRKGRVLKGKFCIEEPEGTKLQSDEVITIDTALVVLDKADSAVIAKWK